MTKTLALIARCGAVAAALLPALAGAQLVNGNFADGLNGWNS